MINYNLYDLLSGSPTTGGDWIQIFTPTPPATLTMPPSGAVPANINKEGLPPGLYTVQYTPPGTCGSPTPVVTSFTVKEKPVVAVAPNPLYFCVFNNVAPAAQAINTTVTNFSNGAAWSGGTLTYGWSTGQTSASINYVPPGPYTTEQYNTITVAAATTSFPICTSANATTFARVSKNINTGAGSNSTLCSGFSTPVNLVSANISGNSAPTPSGAGIRLELKLLSGAPSVPINGGGSVLVGNYYNYTSFQALVFGGFSTGTVLTFEYKYFYEYANGVQGCTFTSAPFTVTIAAAVISGFANPQTICNG